MWKEVAVTYLKKISSHFPGETVEIRENPGARFRTRNFSNTNALTARWQHYTLTKGTALKHKAD